MRTVPPNLKKLRELVEQCQPPHFLSYRDFLAKLYDLAKTELKPYSYLVFAEDLGFSRTNVLKSLSFILLSKPWAGSGEVARPIMNKLVKSKSFVFIILGIVY